MPVACMAWHLKGRQGRRRRPLPIGLRHVGLHPIASWYYPLLCVTTTSCPTLLCQHHFVPALLCASTTQELSCRPALRGISDRGSRGSRGPPDIEQRAKAATVGCVPVGDANECSSWCSWASCRIVWIRACQTPQPRWQPDCGGSNTTLVPVVARANTALA